MSKLEVAREAIDLDWRGVAQRWENAKESWNDPQTIRFEQQHIEPQTEQILRTLDALDKLIDAVGAARHELR